MAQGHDFVEAIDAEVSRTVQGAVRAGATIRSGAQLTVQGVFVGPAVIESDATFMVQAASTVTSSRTMAP